MMEWNIITQNKVGGSIKRLNQAEALAYWGRGIATQAAKATVAYGFKVAHLDKLIALALPENLAAKRVMEKAGLQYEKPIHIFGLDALYYSAKAPQSTAGDTP